MKFRLFALVVIGLTFVVAACSPPPELRNDELLHNPSLVTGDPCAVPCWNGITPGETSFQDAWTILEDSPDLTNVSSEDVEDPNARVLSWQEGDGQPCCWLLSEDGETVTMMSLATAPDVSIGDFVEVHGEPSYVSGAPVSDNQAVMMLVYPDIPLIIYVFVAGEGEGVLSPSSEIIAVYHMTADAMEQAIQGSDLYFWDGYKAYAGYVEGEFDQTAVPTSIPADDDENGDSDE